MLTPGHSKSGAVPADVVPVAVVVAEAKKDEKLDAGALNAEFDEHAASAAPQTATAATAEPRPAQTLRIPTLRMLGDYVRNGLMAGKWPASIAGGPWRAQGSQTSQGSGSVRTRANSR